MRAHLSLWSLTLLALAALPAAAADVPLKHDWFQIELLIFERPASAGDTSAEQLSRSEPRVFHLKTLAFDDGDARSRAYALDAYTLSIPTNPPVDLSYFAAFGIHPSPPTRPRPQTMQPAPSATAPPTPAEQLAAMTAQFEDEVTAQSLKWLPRTALKLGSEARRLGNVTGYRVLLHGAWIQAVPPRETPQPMLIEAGDRGSGAYAVEGTYAVTLQHYLHIDAALWYLAPEQDASARPATYMRLLEQRRVRSTELNYFDHPRFGVLTRIDAIEIPERIRTFAAQIGDSSSARSSSAPSARESP